MGFDVESMQISASASCAQIPASNTQPIFFTSNVSINHKSILSEHVYHVFTRAKSHSDNRAGSLYSSVEITSAVLVQRCSVKNRAVAACNELSCQMCAVMHRE